MTQPTNKRYERDLAYGRGGEISRELRSAIAKFPAWPNDMLHAMAIVGEEYGELLKAVLQFHYEPHKGETYEHIRVEAIQTIAMLHRFLNSLDCDMYQPVSTAQHEFKT